MHTTLENKLKNLYDFLKNNRQYNAQVHALEYKRALLPFHKEKDKVISLMHYIAGTQSQPNINKLAVFFEQVEINLQYDSFENFVNSLDNIPNKDGSTSKHDIANSYWDKLQKLKNKPGWGPKTAALFCKALFKLHNEYEEKLNIWAVKYNAALKTTQGLQLPVDTVIVRVFQKLGYSPATFDSINQLLKKETWDIEVWDDLWFWGFITQKIIDNERVIIYNPEKLWTLIAIPKDPETLAQIKTKSSEFIKLIKND